MSQQVAIVAYEAGNIHSVQTALQRLGVNVLVTSNAREIERAQKVIFPGVGEAGWAMQQLTKTGLDALIPQLQQPVLGICLGMQLMCAGSEESHTRALGIFDVEVKKFRPGNPTQKVPHMGWNDALVRAASPLLGPVGSSSDYYFVHSYYAPVTDQTVLQCQYIHPFSAMLQRDNFYGVQFHPEKSADAGAALLSAFLQL